MSDTSNDRHDCDEHCRCCQECYVTYGEEVCAWLCRHAVAEERRYEDAVDSGGPGSDCVVLERDR